MCVRICCSVCTWCLTWRHRAYSTCGDIEHWWRQALLCFMRTRSGPACILSVSMLLCWHARISFTHTCTVSAVRTPDPACGLHRGTVLGDSCISVHSLPQGRSLCLPCYSIPYDAAVAVVRFARTYDMPHASQYIHAYLTAVVKTCFKSKQCAGIIGCFCAQNGAGVGVMADEFNMHGSANPTEAKCGVCAFTPPC